MRKVWTSGLAISTLVVGCGPKSAPPVARPPVAPSTQKVGGADDAVVASIGSVQIKQSQLEKPLLEAHGYSVLMYVVLRELAHDACRQQGIDVTAADFERERGWTLDQMFSGADETEDREKLLDQFLQQPKTGDQMSTRTEFEIVVETNTYLRKLAEPKRGTAISDEDLKLEFDRTYGSQVRVRHIMVSNTQEALQVKRRLDADEDFAAVAQALSRNEATRAQGGQLPLFTSQDVRLPANIRSVAFSLKEGEVSDPVQSGDSYHILKLEERIAPKAIKYEDVQDALRKSIQERWMVEAVKELRNQFAQQARASLKIQDPFLRTQFEDRQTGRNRMIQGREKISEEMRKQREALAGPTTAPTTGPTTATTTPSITAAATNSTTIPATAPVKPAATTAPVVRPTPVQAPPTGASLATSNISPSPAPAAAPAGASTTSPAQVTPPTSTTTPATQP